MFVACLIRVLAEVLSTICVNSNLSAQKMSKWKNPFCLSLFFFLSQMTEPEFNKHSGSTVRLQSREIALESFFPPFCVFYFGFKASMKMTVLMVVVRCSRCVVVDGGEVFFYRRERLESTQLEQ